MNRIQHHRSELKMILLQLAMHCPQTSTLNINKQKKYTIFHFLVKCSFQVLVQVQKEKVLVASIYTFKFYHFSLAICQVKSLYLYNKNKMKAYKRANISYQFEFVIVKCTVHMPTSPFPQKYNFPIHGNTSDLFDHSMYTSLRNDLAEKHAPSKEVQICSTR